MGWRGALRSMEAAARRAERDARRQHNELLRQHKQYNKMLLREQAILEAYQDYICGCVLRVANETFALLPFQTVIVTAVGDVLNTQTGHLEVKPLMSVVIPRSTLERLNMDTIDPSDSMRNFVCRMEFKKTKGFMVVDNIESSTLHLL
jgi:homogentisate 1,2-dioxygenase